MTDRRSEKRGWNFGWFGSFIWVLILSVVFAVQGRLLAAVLGLTLFGSAGAAIRYFAPWRHPHRTFRQLMVPIYLLILVTFGWGVWASDDLLGFGTQSPWALFILLPILSPLWTVGNRRWSDAGDVGKDPGS
ncbi:MAG: hypothetical protein K8J08_03745 [Thermoanaerobaculia bacterium]|nr:hypothetical protein [Thermoanaerobaculia bacterium]